MASSGATAPRRRGPPPTSTTAASAPAQPWKCPKESSDDDASNRSYGDQRGHASDTAHRRDVGGRTASTTTLFRGSGEFVRLGSRVYGISWRGLVSFVVCAALIVFLGDVFLESVDHVLTAHSDESSSSADSHGALHARHAELLRRGVEADVARREAEAMGTVLAPPRSPLLGDPIAMQAPIVGDFCEATDATGEATDADAPTTASTLWRSLSPSTKVTYSAVGHLSTIRIKHT